MSKYRAHLQSLLQKCKRHRSKNGINPYMKDITCKRFNLLAKIDDFHQQAAVFLQVEVEEDEVKKSDNEQGGEEDEWSSDGEVDEADNELDELDIELSVEKDEDEDEDEEEDDDDDRIQPENMLLQMPSTIGWKTCQERGVVDLMKKEIDLRIAQANDALSQIRAELGHKSCIIRYKKRSGRSQVATRQSNKELSKSSQSLAKHIQSYSLAFKALRALNAEGAFQSLEPGDLKLNLDITEANRISQSSDGLPWFWTMGQSEGESPDKMVEEGKQFS
jgi:hypothetical protein